MRQDRVFTRVARYPASIACDSSQPRVPHLPTSLDMYSAIQYLSVCRITWQGRRSKRFIVMRRTDGATSPGFLVRAFTATGSSDSRTPRRTGRGSHAQALRPGHPLAMSRREKLLPSVSRRAEPQPRKLLFQRLEAGVSTSVLARVNVETSPSIVGVGMLRLHLLGSRASSMQVSRPSAVPFTKVPRVHTAALPHKGVAGLPGHGTAFPPAELDTPTAAEPLACRAPRSGSTSTTAISCLPLELICSRGYSKRPSTVVVAGLSASLMACFP